MVADVLAVRRAIDIEAEDLWQRFPFVVALECYEMLAFEPLYRFEPVADVVIGQVGRLEIGHRTCCVQADVVPVNICLQCIVDEHILFVEFVGELAV